MRRQFMRIFSPVTSLCKCYTKMPLTYFQYSTTTQAQGYKTLFQKLKQSPSNIESVTNILQKLFLHIPQLNVNELKELATTLQATQITDEGQAQKIFDRTTTLFLEEKANLTDTLNVLSAILQRGYSSNHYKQQYHFVAAVSQASNLEASQISSAMYIYGQLVSITHQRNDDVAESLYCHFKNQIDNFKSKDLRDYALGAMMSEEDSDDVYDLIERQALNIEMEFSDLIRVVTAVALNAGGSDELWKLLEEQAIKNISTTDPLNISSLLMIYKQLGHGTQEIYKLMEDSFLQNYDQLTNNIKLEMFSGFARVQHPSSSVFTLFFRDIIKIIDQSSVQSVEMLIYDCLEIFASFPEIVQDYFIDYMIDNKEQMSEPVKEKILEYLQANDLLTDELEVALQQKK